MNEPVYGNHIGVVINTQDPENRGRLQIFVPYLSNTLLEGWNNQFADISFVSSEVNAKLGQFLPKLKNILPWAEVAVPSFGGGTAGPVKPSGNSSPLPIIPEVAADQLAAKQIQSLNTSNDAKSPASDVNSISDISQLDDNVLKYIASIAATESGAFVDDNAGGKVTREAYNLQLCINNTRIQGIAGKRWDQLTDEQKKQVDFGYCQINAENVSNNSEYNLTNRGTLSEQTLSVARFLKKEYPKAYDAIQNGDFATADRYITPFFHGPRNHPTEAANVRNQDANSLRDYITKFDSNPDNLKKQNDELAGINTGEKTDSPIRMKDSLAAESGGTGPVNSGGSAGYFSQPLVGAKVWVFFYGGDIQRPVYFATVMEPSNYQTANQTVAPS